MMHVLEVDSVNIQYGSRRLLSDIYLDCKTGDIIGIFGRNGCGKSTLLKIIFGTEIPQFKVVRLDSKFLKTPFLEPSAISFLTQDDFIPPNLTVEKAIKLSIRNEEVNSFIEDSIIQKIKKQKVGNLSGGERKYLHVKLVLNNDSKFCLLDEPFNGIAPLTIDWIKNLINIKSKEKGVIITDHNYRNVLEISNRIYLIKEGYGRFLNNKEELIQFDYLNQGMLD
jgi:ABC-type lipopolysaccharide export system ATPase subunit